MSRIAKAPISVPSGVVVKISERSVSAKGPKGELSFNLLPGMELEEKDGMLTVSINSDQSAPGKMPGKKVVSMSGTTRAMVYNLVYGVKEGFERKLSIVGVGYRAKAEGDKLNLSLGFSHPVVYQLPQGVSVETPTQTEIIVRGADKQQVGQVAAEIRGFRPPEPYKGKGIRYQDEHVVRKQAKKK